MLERILVPLDGSQTAESVLPQVRRLLRRSDSEVILLRVANPPPGDSFMPRYEETLAASREYVVSLAERLAREGVRAKAVALMGPPAETILEVAGREKATLIALATHGRTGLARMLFGSIAEQVIRESAIPVMAVRPFWSFEVRKTMRPEDQPIGTILIPLDGSDLSQAVLPEAVELAKSFDRVKFVLLHVHAPKGGRLTAAEKTQELDDRGRAEARLKGAAIDLRAKGLEADVLVEQGDAATVIVDTAGVREADLIAMTTHGRSGVSRLVVGSVTEKVLRAARAPLLVVRAPKIEARKEAV